MRSIIFSNKYMKKAALPTLRRIWCHEGQNVRWNSILEDVIVASRLSQASLWVAWVRWCFLVHAVAPEGAWRVVSKEANIQYLVPHHCKHVTSSVVLSASPRKWKWIGRTAETSLACYAGVRHGLGRNGLLSRRYPKIFRLTNVLKIQNGSRSTRLNNSIQRSADRN